MNEFNPKQALSEMPCGLKREIEVTIASKFRAPVDTSKFWQQWAGRKPTAEEFLSALHREISERYPINQRSTE